MPNSSPALPRLSLKHFSDEAIQKAKWTDLERFTIEVLKRYYDRFDLKVRRTQKRSTRDIGSDGAHDGEATIILGGGSTRLGHSPSVPGLASELGIVITLWVEVKKRSHVNLNRHDLGGTIIRSTYESVTKVVFVSNRNFTKEFRDDVVRYAARTGMQFGLIDGKNLLRIARHVLAKPENRHAPLRGEDTARSSQSIAVFLHFTADHLFRHSGYLNSVINRAVNEPIFIVADCVVSKLCAPYTSVTVELHYKGKHQLTITERSGRQHHGLGVGDQFRTTFVLFSQRECELALEDFEVKIAADKHKYVTVDMTRAQEVCRIQGTLLPSCPLSSRRRLHQDLEALINAWLTYGGNKGADIVAIAGAGKTYLVRSTRAVWLNGGAYEVFLDGASEQTSDAVALSILGQIFPIPMDETTAELVGIVTEWLVRSSIPKESATAISLHLCDPKRREGRLFSETQLGHFLALILAKHSEHRPLLLFFEDLHKCLPSAMTMLRVLRQSLSRLGLGRVFTLFTTREDSVWDDEALRRDWRLSMERMRTSVELPQFRLSALSSREATDLIKAAIPTIEDYYAEAIIDQIGTTPFALRESLGLLLERKALQSTGQNGVWRLVNPDELERSIQTRELEVATHYRLKGIRERYPDWFADFLDSGACLGSSFDPELCESLVQPPKRSLLDTAVAECRQLEILRVTLTSPFRLQFDHDLIRTVLLRDMGTFRQRRLAKALFGSLSEKASSATLGSLAYQAGLAEECWLYCMKQARAAAGAHRHMEAVHVLGLALSVTDQNLSARIFDVQEGRYRPAFDEAIAVANPCLRAGFNRAEQEQEVAKLLILYIEHLVAVGSGATPSAVKALTEGAMLAERLKNHGLRALIKMFQGRLAVNNNRFPEGVKLHEQAETIFASMKPDEAGAAKRPRNLVRLAIAYRQLGLIEKSLQTLIEAIKLRKRHDWALLVDVQTDYGAAFFYSDWERTRHHWARALKTAKQHGLTDDYVHFLIDVGYLDLLEDQYAASNEKLEEALTLSRTYGLENSELRCLLHLGCLALIDGNLGHALRLLREAEELGFRHQIGRRLWRTRANIATAYFLLGEVERSVSADQAALGSMPPLEGETVDLDNERPSAGTRIVLALANIALRARASDSHRELLLRLPIPAQSSANQLATKVAEGHLDDIPGLRGRHCKSLGGKKFFVITE